MGTHDGHRQRLKESFLSCGLEGKSEHQILELILFYAIPRIDVNPIAHELISKFGSLANVIDASPDKLKETPYITDNAVVLIKLFPQVAKAYRASRWETRPRLCNNQEVLEYLQPMFENERNEVMQMLCLDSQCRVCGFYRLSEGTPTETAVHPRSVVSYALQCNAKIVFLAHNHPSGNENPSANDLTTTQRISAALSSIGIDLKNHFIFAGKKIGSVPMEYCAKIGDEL